MRKNILLALLAILLPLAPAARAEKPLSQDGPAPHARAGRSVARHDRSLTVTIDVDLTGVVIDGHPAVLGAYVASITFDPKAVELVDVKGADAGAFTTTPAATDKAKANGSGLVKLAAAQTNSEAPAGVVAVARLSFVEKAAGGADSIHIHIDSAATTHRAANGSTAIVPLATE